MSMQLILEINKLISSYYNLTTKEIKEVLRNVVADNWRQLPPWSTLEKPIIEEVQKASVASGAALVFYEDNDMKVVLLKAGSHYNKDEDLYMNPGGYLDLSELETCHDAVVREISEEIRTPSGKLFDSIEVNRLVLCDTTTLKIAKEIVMVVGFILFLYDFEIKKVKEHIEKQKNKEYLEECSKQTINDGSGKPEVDSLTIVSLRDIINEKVRLLHPDQLSLFKKIKKAYKL